MKCFSLTGLVSIATTHICHRGTEAAIDSTLTNGRGCVPVTLHLQKSGSHVAPQCADFVADSLGVVTGSRADKADKQT